jgi:hypothetical protein
MRWTSIRKLAMSVIVVMLIAPLGQTVGHAEPSVGGFDLRSGLMTFAGGRTSIRVTVTDVGGRGAMSRVRIMLLDDSDRLLLNQENVMQPGQPVRANLRLESFAGTFMQARMIVQITFESGSGHAPVAVLEHLDADSLAIVPRVACGPPAGRVDPVTLAKCDGLVVTQIITTGG